MEYIFALVLPAFLGLGQVSAPVAGDTVRGDHELVTNGFSINALEIGETGDSTVPVLTLMLPATERFAPNVNVQIQPFDGTLDEYADLSRAQFAEAKAKVIFYKRSGDALVGEYAADLQGRKLHFYARTLQSGDRIYLATATATETQWPSVGAKLKACVDSLSIPPAKK